MKNKWIRNVLILVGIVILFACINATNGDRKEITIIEQAISAVINVPQKGFHYLSKWFAKDQDFFSEVEALKLENEALKIQNEQLQAKMLDYEVIRSENNMLKEHTKTTEKYAEYTIVAAEIISMSPSNWQEIYVINKGAKDGIKVNMPVIANDGLVGYITSVTNHTAKVVSILDAGNSVSARLTNSRDAVICKGTTALREQGLLKITYLPIGAEISMGDKVETSGMGGIYPKGIAIGTVKEVILKKNPLENEATVEPFVDFNKLETVAVIISENTLEE